MPKTYGITRTRFAGGMVAGFFLWAGLLSTGWAQLHVPKIPGASKTSETKPSSAGTLEVVSTVSPDAVPPGGHGQIVLTGQNFKDGMQVQFACQGAQFKAESVKVESPTRAVARVLVPEGKENAEDVDDPVPPTFIPALVPSAAAAQSSPPGVTLVAFGCSSDFNLSVTASIELSRTSLTIVLCASDG